MVRPARQHILPWEAGVGGVVGAGLATGVRRPEVEEARQLLDGHHTLTAARTLYGNQSASEARFLAGDA